MSANYLDRSAQAGRDQTWTLTLLVPASRHTFPTSTQPFDTQVVELTAAKVEIVDGALVFRTESGGLVQAFSPGTWMDLVRA